MLTTSVRAERGPGKSRVLPYSQLPHELIEDPRLTPTDVRLAGVIMRFARAKSTAWPAIATLAQAIRRCRRTVQYSLKRLAEAGWILSRPDTNPTGRVLVLAWRERERQAAPPAARPPLQPYTQGLPRERRGGVQSTARPSLQPYTQGLPRESRGGVQPTTPTPVQLPARALPRNTVAPECAKNPFGEENDVARATGTRRTTPTPLSPEEIRAFWHDSGFLDRPPGDPLRTMTERRLEALPSGAVLAVRAAPGPDPRDGDAEDLPKGVRRLFP